MSENVPKLINSIKPQTQESQRIPRKINTKQSVPSYLMFKLQKIDDKYKIFQEAIQ